MRLGPPRPKRTRIGRRRYPHVAREQPLEMVRRIAHRRRQHVEPKRLLRRLDQRRRSGYRLAVACHLVGPAAQTGAIARPARAFRIEEKLDMLALRPPRRAAWLAVDSGGGYCPDHPPVPAPVTRLERVPRGILVNCSHQHGHTIASPPSHRFPWLAIKEGSSPKTSSTATTSVPCSPGISPRCATPRRPRRAMSGRWISCASRQSVSSHCEGPHSSAAKSRLDPDPPCIAKHRLLGARQPMGGARFFAAAPRLIHGPPSQSMGPNSSVWSL